VGGPTVGRGDHGSAAGGRTRVSVSCLWATRATVAVMFWLYLALTLAGVVAALAVGLAYG
jgi:hypothetical protein